MMKNRFLFVISLAALSFSVSADIYKWVDANGKVHYSNTPPPEVKGTKVKVEDPAPTATGGTPSATAEYWKQKDAEFRKRQEDKYKGEKESSDNVALDDAEKRKKTCEFYRKDLDQVLGTRERVTRSADGNDIIVDAKAEPLNNTQRARVIGELNDAIAKNCN
jgi:Domain of unknown function (DUF4124)